GEGRASSVSVAPTDSGSPFPWARSSQPQGFWLLAKIPGVDSFITPSALRNFAFGATAYAYAPASGGSRPPPPPARFACAGEAGHDQALAAHGVSWPSFLPPRGKATGGGRCL